MFSCMPSILHCARLHYAEMRERGWVLALSKRVTLGVAKGDETTATTFSGDVHETMMPALSRGCICGDGAILLAESKQGKYNFTSSCILTGCSITYVVVPSGQYTCANNRLIILVLYRPVGMDHNDM